MCMTNTLYFIILWFLPISTLVSEVQVCIKVLEIGHLSSKPGKLRRKSIGLQISILWVRVSLWASFFFNWDFVAFDALLAGQLVLYKYNQACRSSDVYRCIERMIICKKNGGGDTS